MPQIARYSETSAGGGTLDAYAGHWGDGSDGDVTILTNTTLTRNTYYNNLTVSNGATLVPNGYKVFVKGTLTVDAGGTIQRNGNSGQSASGTAAGVAAGAIGATALGGGAAGGIGNAGGISDGATPSGAPGASTGMGGTGGDGGNSGKGSVGSPRGGRAGGGVTYQPHVLLSENMYYSASTLIGG
ncbi:hypothetical protein EON83_30540, partial [bacterium]